MATPEQLVEQYRAQQASIGAVTAVVMLRLWPLLLDAGDQEATDRWVDTVVRLITIQRGRSSLLGQAFIGAYRREALGAAATPFIPTPEPVNIEKIQRSLYATGVNRLQAERLAAQRRQDERTSRQDVEARVIPSAPVPAPTLESIQAAVARSAQRHALDGGRTVVDDTIRRDVRVLGFQRVGRAKPCFWCAMLNSRGPVYQGASFESADPRFTGPGNAKCHDGCGCSLIPLYKRSALADTPQPQQEALWISATKGKSGPAAIKEFRRHYEGRALRD